jgi:hypothetical protein
MQKNLLCIVFLLTCVKLFSQAPTVELKTINVCGGYNDNPSSYYRFEWSIGDAASIQTFTTSSLIVTTGVLEPSTQTPAGANTASVWASDEIKILPNPVATELEIDILSKQRGKINLVMYDGNGKAVEQRQFTYNGLGRIEKIVMARFAAAQYFLKITLEPDPGSVAKKGGFKIVKINN